MNLADHVKMTDEILAELAIEDRMECQECGCDFEGFVKPKNRMDYSHICQECGCDFKGFVKQHTCWRCIDIFVSWFPFKKKNNA